MRQFYEAWEHVFINRQSVTAEISPLSINEIEINLLTVNSSPIASETQADTLTINRQLSTADLQLFDLESFMSIGFTHHCEILAKAKSLQERLFYIRCCATEFWSVEKLKYISNAKSNAIKGKLPNNFNTTISNTDLQRNIIIIQDE